MSSAPAATVWGIKLTFEHTEHRSLPRSALTTSDYSSSQEGSHKSIHSSRATTLRWHDLPRCSAPRQPTADTRLSASGPPLTPFLLLALCLLAFAGNTIAGTVNLAWGAISGAEGYRLSYGTSSSQYSTNVDVGNKTSTTLSGLTEGTRYYFALRAYAGSLTSPYSNEVSTVIASTGTVPVASFTANGSSASSLSVTQGQSVNFVDTSSGTVASRSWNFGDGTSATAATVVKSYSTIGSKTVALTVTGAGATRTASKTVNVTAAPPLADFSATPRTGAAPLTVAFADASSGSITSRNWTFGNGASSTAQSPTTTYSTAGTYTVSLTVTGPGGSNTATKTGYITVSTTSGGGDNPVDPSGLVAAFGFDESSGTQVLDASGNGNHGTLSNVTRSSQSKFGRALSFNGSNSLVTVGDSDTLDLTNGVTLSAWVYPTSWANDWKTLIMKERSGGLVYTLNANSDAGQPNSTLRIGSSDRQLSAGSHLPTNTWTHLAATYDGARQRLYVNGVQVGSRAQIGTLDVSANPLRIGGNSVWTGQFFQGIIDEVRIYNRALSQAEIESVSTEPVVKATGICTTPCGLWNDATTPSTAANWDTSPVEVGVKLRSDVDGVITGVRFYKGTANTRPHVGRLWSSAGQLLAQATFTKETASGWQQVNFASPVAVKANTTYVASYHTTVGRYAYNEGYFSSAYSNGPLSALSSGASGGNGVYRYGSGGVFPTQTYQSANYWVDVIFKTE